MTAQGKILQKLVEGGSFVSFFLYDITHHGIIPDAWRLHADHVHLSQIVLSLCIIISLVSESGALLQDGSQFSRQNATPGSTDECQLGISSDSLISEH